MANEKENFNIVFFVTWTPKNIFNPSWLLLEEKGGYIRNKLSGQEDTGSKLSLLVRIPTPLGVDAKDFSSPKGADS